MASEALFGSPYNNLQAPFRYLVESDSDDEAFEEDAGSRSSTRPMKEPVVTCTAKSKGKQVWIALDQPGETWTSALRGLTESSAVTVNDEQVASCAEVQDGLVLSCSSANQPLAHLYPLAECIIRTLEPSLLCIIDSYTIERYLTKEDSPLSILHLQTPQYPSSRLKTFAVPNLKTGLAAALMTVALELSLPAQLLLLPALSDRPEGIYDPIPFSRLTSPESPLMQALKSANAAELRWPSTWSFKNISGNQSGWVWKRKQDRQRQKKQREERGIESMYL